MPNNNLDYIAERTADTLLEDFTTSLRTLAHVNGWPSNIISALEVDYKDGDLVITYPEELAEQIENLEYGDINSLPNAVLRPFILRAIYPISGAMEQYALGAIMLEEGVV